MRSGTSIAHYRIGELIGRGGMGEVYRALDTRLDRAVALKFLAARFVPHPEAKERFIREAKAASSLDHPNICTIHDIGETEDGDLYIVMALYEGRTLDRLLEDGPLEIEAAVRIIRQVAEALKRAHAGGIIHRDVKPANVIVSPDGAVRLLDFGVAKLQAAEALTGTGVSIGTSGYMSPEQASGDPVTPASDVWSLGVMAYEMLGGRRPFRAETPLAVLNQILTIEPQPIAEVRADAPEALAEVVHRALAKRPDDRFDDAASFLEALDSIWEGTSAKASRSRPAPLGLRPPGLSAAALVVLVVAVVVVVWRPQPPATPDAPGFSRDIVAVLPFAVSGAPDLQYLSEGMVNLIGGRMDGAGPLRVVDPRAVLGLGAFEPGEVVDRARGAEIATTLGAGRFITGEVVGLPGRITISARLHEVEPGAEDSPQVTREGSADSLAVIVDRIAIGLLANSLSGANARIQQSAAQSSQSPEATKEFLRGEQFHRRGQFDSAAVAYNRALAHDSTFALAHLMKSLNNAFTYETDDFVAAEKAWRFSRNLSERDRSLIQAFFDQQSGRLAEAEERFLAHLKRWPDEVKALIMLGMLYKRSNPRLGLPIEQARPLFTKALELEPENVQVLHRLARMDAGSRLYDSLPARAATLQRVAPDSEWAIDARTMAAFALGDTAEIGRLLDTFPEQHLLLRLYAIYNAMRFSPDPQDAVRLIARQEEGSLNTATGLPGHLEVGDDLSIALSVMANLVGGRYNEVRAFLEDPPRTAAWSAWCAELIAADLVPVDRAVMERTLERLQAVEPEDRLRNPFEPLHDIFSVEVATLERDFTAAKLLGRLGRMDEAWAVQRRIAQHPPFLAFESLHTDAAGALAADLYALAGDHERALTTLRSLTYQLPLTASALSVTTASHARHLQAELEWEMGDREVARYLYAGLVEGFAPPDKIFLANAYERLGQIHAAAGRADEAIYHYDRFVRAWATADEEQQPRRRAAQSRLEALRSASP